MSAGAQTQNGQAATWLIKVLTGPHQGAEMQVPPGRLLVGSDEAADLVIADVLVSPQHAALDLGSNAITVEPLGGRVYCNGKRIQSKAEKVPALSFLTLGGSTLVAGLAAQNWPLLSAADIPALEPDPPEPKAEEPPPAAAKVESAPAEPAPEATPKPAARTKTRSPRLWRALFGLVAGLLLLLIWALFAWFYRGDWDRSEPPPVSAKDKVAAVLQQSGLEHELQVESAGDRLQIKGYVATDDELTNLNADLRAAAPAANLQIYSRQHMEAQARSLLAQQGLNLNVSVLPGGQLRIAGYVDNPKSWVRAKEMVSKEIPGVTGIDDQVGIHSYAVVEGSPSPTPVNDNANKPAATATPVPVSSLFVAEIRKLGDGTDFVRLSDGEVFFNGAKLPNNWTVKEIQRQGVIIQSRAGDSVRLNLGDNIWELTRNETKTSPTAQP